MDHFNTVTGSGDLCFGWFRSLRAAAGPAGMQMPPDKGDGEARWLEKTGAAPCNMRSHKTVSEKCSPLVPLPSPPFILYGSPTAFVTRLMGWKSRPGPGVQDIFLRLAPRKAWALPK